MSGTATPLAEADATAAATRLMAAEAPVQELAFTVEAFRQVLPLHGSGPPPVRATEALLEALTVVRRMIRQPNNEGLVTWATECAVQVREASDLDVLQRHFMEVLRIYGVLAALPSRGSSSAPH